MPAPIELPRIKRNQSDALGSIGFVPKVSQEPKVTINSQKDATQIAREHKLPFVDPNAIGFGEVSVADLRSSAAFPAHHNQPDDIEPRRYSASPGEIIVPPISATEHGLLNEEEFNRVRRGPRQANLSDSSDCDM